MIDSNLSWKYHIESICHKISKSIGIIAKIRHYVPRRVLLSVYNSLIVPYLTYGICGWGNCALAFQRKIVALQKRALRLIYFSKSKEHAVPFFSNQIAFPCLAYFSEIVAIYCMISTDRTAPVSILNQFVKTSKIHNYRARSVSSDSFYQGHPTTVFWEISVRSPLEWLKFSRAQEQLKISKMFRGDCLLGSEFRDLCGLFT